MSTYVYRHRKFHYQLKIKPIRFVYRYTTGLFICRTVALVDRQGVIRPSRTEHPFNPLILVIDKRRACPSNSLNHCSYRAGSKLGNRSKDTNQNYSPFSDCKEKE